MLNLNGFQSYIMTIKGFMKGKEVKRCACSRATSVFSIFLLSPSWEISAVEVQPSKEAFSYRAILRK